MTHMVRADKLALKEQRARARKIAKAKKTFFKNLMDTARSYLKHNFRHFDIVFEKDTPTIPIKRKESFKNLVESVQADVVQTLTNAINHVIRHFEGATATFDPAEGIITVS